MYRDIHIGQDLSGERGQVCKPAGVVVLVLELVLETDAWVAGAHEVEQFITVLTDERFQVVTSHIMPLDAIIIEIVQNGEAGFIITLQNIHTRSL
jgi:hypothetical protein